MTMPPRLLASVRKPTVAGHVQVGHPALASGSVQQNGSSPGHAHKQATRSSLGGGPAVDVRAAPGAAAGYEPTGELISLFNRDRASTNGLVMPDIAGAEPPQQPDVNMDNAVPRAGLKRKASSGVLQHTGLFSRPSAAGNDVAGGHSIESVQSPPGIRQAGGQSRPLQGRSDDVTNGPVLSAADVRRDEELSVNGSRDRSNGARNGSGGARSGAVQRAGEQVPPAGTARSHIGVREQQHWRQVPRHVVTVGDDARNALPARKVFPIQIGSELFRLSGASITSDAPSYFSKFFEEQLRGSPSADEVRTLYIDRDPDTFRLISLHLQGYHVEPEDCTEYVRLFADAQFFSLPRLTEQLYKSTIYVQIGDREFKIPRELFDGPGNSPNYFTLGFSSFFSTPNDVFPGLDRAALLRPPSLQPSKIPGRSARVFDDLLNLLKGYLVHIRDEDHRNELLRDARYYNFRGVEQMLIPHRITCEPWRAVSEIFINVCHIQNSGIDISFVGAYGAPANRTINEWQFTERGSPIHRGPEFIAVTYKRPYVDEKAHELVVELDGAETYLVHPRDNSTKKGARNIGYVIFPGQTEARVLALYDTVMAKITNKQGEQEPFDETSTRSDDFLTVVINVDSDVEIDGAKWRAPCELQADLLLGLDTPAELDYKVQDMEPYTEGKIPNARWAIDKAQWRVSVQHREKGLGWKVVLHAVKIKAYTGDHGRNAGSSFLS